MKTILVTGANGQLGSELKDLSVAYPEFKFTFVDIADLDLLDEPKVNDLFNQTSFNFLINCAAYTAVDRAEEESFLCHRVNADAVGVLARIAREKNIRLIHISTDYVFDGEFNQPIDERATPRPLSVYGQSKLAGETLLMATLANAYIIRTSWVYSTHGKNFVKTMTALMKQRTELGVVADQFGTPTYARDLAHAIMVIVQHIAAGKVDSPGIYHYTNEGALTWYDFAMFIRNFYQLPCQVNPIRTAEYRTAASRPKFSVLDKTKIKQTFALNIPHWSESLEECLNKLEK